MKAIEIHDQQPVIEVQPTARVIEIFCGMPGRSAYELAVSRGFAGTLDEFLSLCRIEAGESLSSNCFVTVATDGRLVRADVGSGLAATVFVRESAAVGEMAILYPGQFANGYSGLQTGKAVYLGAAGQITQTIPASGLHQELGQAVSNDTIRIEIQNPVHIL